MTHKLYEFETKRSNITPKQFWTHCAKAFEKKTGRNFEWLDSFEYWSNPTDNADNTWKHEDWDEPKTEICRIKPFNIQLYLQGSYNFIMEFDFWDDKTGWGYCYAYEMTDKEDDTEKPLTKAQTQAVERIKKDIQRWYGDNFSNYEYKTFKLTSGYKSHYLYVVVGRVGDEGTMAEIFCRDKAHFAIGERGRIMVDSNYRKSSGFCRPYKGWVDSFLAYNGKEYRQSHKATN